MLKVTRRTREVDIILNQQIAEDIARLGDTLSRRPRANRLRRPGRTGRLRPPPNASNSYANRRMRRH